MIGTNVPRRREAKTPCLPRDFYIAWKGGPHMRRTIRIAGIVLLHLAIGLYLIAVISGSPLDSRAAMDIQSPYRQSTAYKR